MRHPCPRTCVTHVSGPYSPPHPLKIRKAGSLRERSVVIGGETGSSSGRATGFAPNGPPLPGQGTPPGGGCRLAGIGEVDDFNVRWVVAVEIDLRLGDAQGVCGKVGVANIFGVQISCNEPLRRGPKFHDLGEVFFYGVVAGEPVDVGETSKPFHLPSGELAGGHFDLFDGVVEGYFAGQMIYQLAISCGLGGGEGQCAVGGQEVAGFF
jgi:hypothetical protein